MVLAVRQSDVARLVAAGLSNGEIARALHVDVETVRSTVSKCLRRTGARNRAHLAAWYVLTCR